MHRARYFYWSLVAIE